MLPILRGLRCRKPYPWTAGTPDRLVPYNGEASRVATVIPIPAGLISGAQPTEHLRSLSCYYGLVPAGGFGPPTHRIWICCSTTELHRHITNHSRPTALFYLLSSITIIITVWLLFQTIPPTLTHIRGIHRGFLIRTSACSSWLSSTFVK